MVKNISNSLLPIHMLNRPVACKQKHFSWYFNGICTITGFSGKPLNVQKPTSSIVTPVSF